MGNLSVASSYGNTISLFGCIAKLFLWAVNLLFQFGFAKREAEVILLKLLLKCRNFGMTLGASWINFSVFFKLDATIYRAEDHRSEKAGGVVTSFNTVR